MSAGSTAAREGLLSSYLLSEQPGCIVLIGSQQIDIQWSEKARLLPMLKFEALCAYGEEEDIIAPVVAIVQLDDQSECLDHVLGRAVRLFPERLIVCTESAAQADQHFFAFGFRRLDVVNSATSNNNTRWFEYQLSTYKSSPDWLNARFWANPERFGLEDEFDIYVDDEEYEEE